MSSGLLFVLSDDPISRIVASVTKQEFSTLGYYYSYGKGFKVHLTDPFGHPLYECEDLNSLASNPIVRRVSIRPVKPEYENAFRLSLSRAPNKPVENIKEGIYELFGFPSPPGKGFSPLGMMETVMRSMGHPLQQSPVCTIYGSGFEGCLAPPRKEKNIGASVQVLAYLASQLNQQTCPEVTTNGVKLPAQIQSYILDEEFFAPMQHLRLTREGDNYKSLRAVYEEQLPILKKGIETFLGMLKEPGFLFIVAKGARNQSTRLIEESLKDCLALQDSLFQEAGPLLPPDKSKKFREALVFERKKASSLLGGDPGGPVDQGGIPEPPSSGGGGYLESFRELLVETITRQKPLDLRHLVEIHNGLGGEEIDVGNLLRRVRRVKGSYHLSAGEVGIVLKSGDRLNLSLNSPDLTCFDYETLVEILDSLDSLAQDPLYDELRTNLAEEIASYSSSHGKDF